MDFQIFTNIDLICCFWYVRVRQDKKLRPVWRCQHSWTTSSPPIFIRLNWQTVSQIFICAEVVFYCVENLFNLFYFPKSMRFFISLKIFVVEYTFREKQEFWVFVFRWNSSDYVIKRTTCWLCQVSFSDMAGLVCSIRFLQSIDAWKQLCMYLFTSL